MLRQLRVSADRTRKDAAEWLEIGEPTLSKIELGRQAIKGPHVRLLCQLYDVDAGTLDNLLRLAKEAGQRGWWTAYRDTVPDWFRYFVGLEGDAADLWNYESEFVPGLLQTSAYVEAIGRGARPDISDADVARSVELRRERQSRIDGETPPRLHFYLNEAVLRRRVGSADVMREQLEHLYASSELEHITLRVVPFSAGAHPAMSGSFVLMRFPDEDSPAFAYLENERGAIYQEDPGDIARYSLMVEQLGGMALDAEESRAMLKRLSEQ
ncbi:helix-turn-helix domain-containing protein [Haloactinomyces albus]|uniref:Transcriptional regulator with XRE-family HTH domain n=1 Tax=Haloactinomyces albus TaxID=1352928 RepID=A0AAE3ZGY8_9ACTN|nr:helix-turn-helix transcriptional regulator [Haloactinomyces albus]MDR7303022.1 transcriptional regulator with XRE-family HTH domain [Haloactinomyces albus]